MADPYQILGVARTATQAEIRKAYLRLAKKSHPDLHPGDKGAEARFKDIASANDIVGNAEKRARFDSGEIDASGAEVHRQPEREFYRQHAEAEGDFKYDRGWSGGDPFNSGLFDELFGAHSGRINRRGVDVAYTFAVDFVEAVNGAKKRVVMADGKVLDVSIPAGLEDGQTLRLRGQGQPGAGDAEPGDILAEIHVKPHPSFRRDGATIRSKLELTLGEALGGTKLPVETVSGVVQLTIPRGSKTGSILRLRGKGVRAKSGPGDHLVELSVILPDDPDDALINAVAEWEAKHPYNPRRTSETLP
jgi:DnaJ-class molecular chaperone